MKPRTACCSGATSTACSTPATSRSREHSTSRSAGASKEFENGRQYYELHGRTIAAPDHPSSVPDRAALTRHNEGVSSSAGEGCAISAARLERRRHPRHRPRDAQVPIYDLPIWALDEFPGEIQGAGWKIGARQVSGHSREEQLKHFLEMRKRYPHYAITHMGLGNGETRIAPQLFVEATSRIVAQQVCDLVVAAFCVIDGCATFNPGNLLALPHDLSDLEDLDEDDPRGSHDTIGRYGVLLASRLAAKCSRRKPLSYALFKLGLSFQTASAHWIDLDPGHGPKRFGVVKDPKISIALANATTLAYSAIEELQLETQAYG